MKQTVFLFSALLATLASAVPVVENVSLVQDDSKVVKISYDLSESPAIVTLDIQTNVTGDVWASIGIDAIVAGLTADSAAFRRVESAGAQKIRWRPHRVWRQKGGSLPAGSVRAVVTAWSTEFPPDYMAVDLGSGQVRYYPNAAFVPGGVLANQAYRQSAMLLRRIPAGDVTWTMGSIGEDGRNAPTEAARLVTLTNDYYMAVFETTQEQWRQITGTWPSVDSQSNPGSYSFTNGAYRAMRPAQNISYNEIRTSGSRTTYNASSDYPNRPHESSFLGILNARTGLSFDLPSEAQWEFACRAGNGENRWGNGALYVNATTMPGRCSTNGGFVGGKTQPSADCDPSSGTAICGSYEANSFGLYDLHGNVFELCVDWYQDAVPKSLGAAPNIDLADPSKRFDGTSGVSKVKRGGAYSHGYGYCRSASRAGDQPKTQYYNFGCRVICPVR